MGVEPDLVAHDAADGLVEFFGDAFGDRPGGDAAGLGVADPAGSAGVGIDGTAAGLETELRKLGGLARSGLPGDDHHLVLSNGCHDLVVSFVDR